MGGGGGQLVSKSVEAKETKYFEIIFEKGYHEGNLTIKSVMRKNRRKGVNYESLGEGKYRLSDKMMDIFEGDVFFKSLLKSASRDNGKNIITFRKSDAGGYATLYEISEKNKGKPGDFNIHYVGSYGEKTNKKTYVVSLEVLNILKEKSPVKFKIIGERKDNTALIHSSFI